MQIKFHSETNVMVECTPDFLELFRIKLEECHPIEWKGKQAFDFKEFLNKFEIPYDPYILERIEHSRMLMLNCVFDEEKNLFSFLLEYRPIMMSMLNPSEILEKIFNTNDNKLFYKCCIVIMAKPKHGKVSYETNDKEGKYFD